MVGAAYLAGAFGSKLAAALWGLSSAREQARRRRQEQLALLRPLEAMAFQEGFGASESTGSQIQGAVRQRLSSLGSRGVLNSSVAPSEVAEAIAPYEERRQARRQGLLERIAAAKEAIYAGSEMPGFGDVAAGLLGEAGSVLASEYGRARRKADVEEFMAEYGWLFQQPGAGTSATGAELGLDMTTGGTGDLGEFENEARQGNRLQRLVPR